MKILYHHRLGSKDGQYVHVTEIINSLRNQGHEVIIVEPKMLEQNDFGGETPVVALLKRNLPQFLYEIAEFSYSFIAFLKIMQAAIKHKPDFIYERFSLYMIAGVIAKRILGIPLILEINAPLYEERSDDLVISLKRFARWTQYYTFKHADLLLPVTQVLGNIVKTYKVPEEKIDVIHNGINREEFVYEGTKKEYRERINIPERLTIGFVGFLRGWHKLEYLLESFAAATADSNASLVIIGDGPGTGDLKLLAEQLGIGDRLHITGIVDRSAMPIYIAALDIAILPNVVGYSSPLKLFEYLAMQCAVIAPDTGNIREILIDGETALLFERGEVDQLTENMKTLLENPELRERIAAAGRQLLIDAGFTWNENARRIIRHARLLIEKSSNI